MLVYMPKPMSGLGFLISLILLLIAVPANASDIQTCGRCHSDIAEDFTKSLHYTNQGIIERWNKGVGKDLGIPLPQECLSCHIEDCSTCHPIHKTLPNMTTCVKCHRNGANYIGNLSGIAGNGKNPDIHYEHNLTCSDCHSIEEIHGDGNPYPMAYLAVKVRCENCHMNESVVVNGIKPKRYDPNILAHSIHGDRISCYGCHAGWYQTCASCHLEQKIAEGATIDEFYLVKHPDGKLYPATRMFVFYGENASQIWSAVYPHTITKEGRNCEDCHNNEKEVFCVSATGKVMPPGSSFAEPPSSLVISLAGLDIDTEFLTGVIIGGTLLGICIHFVRRKITLRGE